MEVVFDLIHQEVKPVFQGGGKGPNTYQMLFKALKRFDISSKTLAAILRLFDGNIRDLQMVDEHNYKLFYGDLSQTLSEEKDFKDDPVIAVRFVLQAELP